MHLPDPYHARPCKGPTMTDHQLTCRKCGKQFQYHRRKIHCGDECRRLDKNAKLKAWRANGESTHGVCEGCGIAKPKLYTGLCPCCMTLNKSIRVQNFMRARRGSNHLPPRLVTTRSGRTLHCAECGALHSYTPEFGSERYEYKYCSHKCRKRASDRDRTRARRAATRGAEVETVNYNVVFDRDAWRCGLCGVKTLRARRGSPHDRAPVLDHIVPLSKGGKHTYQNVQCACNACNSKKGASLIGQLRLFG